MYIKSLHVTNLRCFAHAELNFQYPGLDSSLAQLPNVNLLLGNNGAGKTTVLMAIALSTLSPIIEGAGYVPYHLIRYGNESATVEAEVILHAQDLEDSFSSAEGTHRFRTKVVGRRDYEQLAGTRDADETWTGIYDDVSPAFFLAGYGATRRVETSESFDPASQRKSRRLRYQRVAGLFEDHIALTPLAAWLTQLTTRSPSRVQEIEKLFNKLLPEGTQLDVKGGDGDILFSQDGVRVPFGAMSDGYRAYIGWVGDLLYQLHTIGNPKQKLAELRGVVLVDEVDLHLHPEWQRYVAHTLSTTLPHIQFVLTTHSPIVTGTLTDVNIFVMDREPSGASTVRQLEEKVYGLTADQVLLSSYFNLKTSRAPGAEKELREIARRAWTGDSSAAAEFLKKLSGEDADPS